MPLLLAAILFQLSIAHADSPDFNSLYAEKKYDAAAHLLESKPESSVSYFYNLGTVYFQMGQPGLAVAYLEKANHLKPHDANIQQNLITARAALSRVIGKEGSEDRLDPATTWPEYLTDHMSLDEIRGIFGLTVLILLLIWLRSYLATRDVKSTLLKPSGMVALLGLVIVSGLYFVETSAESHPAVFCLSRQSIRSGPGEHFVELSSVEAGIKLRALGPDTPSDPPTEPPQQWRQVRFSANQIGWVRASSLLLL